MKVVLFGVILSSGSSFYVVGSAKYGSLFTWSVLAKGMYMSCPFLRSMSMLRWLLVIQVLCSDAGAYLCCIECISSPRESVVSKLSGSIFSVAKRGAVCAV